MTNREKGEFDLAIGDHTLTFTLKTAGLIALQQRFSTPEKLADLGEIFAAISSGSLEHQVAFVWASLRKHHPGIDFPQTIELIDEVGGVVEMMRQLAEVAESTQPDRADLAELPEAKANPRKARVRRGTGGNGTSSHAAQA